MKEINLTDKQRRWIVVGIAFIFIFMGFLKGVFGIGLEGRILDKVELVLMVLAFFVLFARKKTEEEQPEDQTEEVIEDTAEDINKE